MWCFLYVCLFCIVMFIKSLGFLTLALLSQAAYHLISEPQDLPYNLSSVSSFSVTSSRTLCPALLITRMNTESSLLYPTCPLVVFLCPQQTLHFILFLSILWEDSEKDHSFHKSWHCFSKGTPNGSYFVKYL
jgi:hypothetical protein